MSWAKWAKPGRVEDFRFYRLSSLNGSRTRIDGVTECSITLDWTNKTIASGNMTRRVKGRDFIDNEYVRIFFLPTIDGKSEEIELATFVGRTTNATLDENGWWTQHIELVSPLCRYSESDIWWNATLEAGKSGIALFKSAMKKLKGSYTIDGLKDWKIPDTKVVEFGKPGLDLLQAIVGETYVTAKGNRGTRKITLDRHGRLVLTKSGYLNAYARSGRNEATIDDSLPINPGISRTCSWQSSATRIALAYTEARWDNQWTVIALSDEQVGEYGYPGKMLWPIVSAEKLGELDYDDADGGNWMYITVESDTFTVDMEYGENEYKAVNHVEVNGVVRTDYRIIGKTQLRFDEQLHEGDYVALTGIEVFRPPWERKENAETAIRKLAREKFIASRFERGGAPTYTVSSKYLPTEIGSYYLLDFGGIRANAMCERIVYKISDHIEQDTSFRLAGGDSGMNGGTELW